MSVGTSLHALNHGSEVVSVMDTGAGNRITDFPDWRIPIDPILVGKSLYVVNYDSDIVSVIDKDTGKQITDFSFDSPLGAMLIGKTYLCVLHTINALAKGKISVIDTTTNTQIGFDIEVGYIPKSATYIAGKWAVACADGLYLIHLDKLLSTVTTIVASASSASSSSYK